MKIKKINDYYIVKLELNELVLESLKKLIIDKKIGFAKISAIGMVSDVSFGFLSNGAYVWKTWNETVELTSLEGSVAWDDEDKNKPLIHLHGTIANEEYKVYGGHFGEAKVAGTVEVFITNISDEKIFKKYTNDVKFKTLNL